MKNFTNYINKIILSKIIIINYCLIFSLSANASGFIFFWKPLVIDNDLVLSKTGTEIFTKNLSAFDFKIPISDDYINKFALSTDQEGASTQKAEKKSIAENIKINFLMSDSLMIDKNQIYSDRDDEKISKIIDALTSLIYDDSKHKSLETIGRIIEPHINFYFEF
jgi:uncharacterized Zn-finger protein